jgi:hypothetical protein
MKIGQCVKMLSFFQPKRIIGIGIITEQIDDSYCRVKFCDEKNRSTQFR